MGTDRRALGPFFLKLHYSVIYYVRPFGLSESIWDQACHRPTGLGSRARPEASHRISGLLVPALNLGRPEFSRDSCYVLILLQQGGLMLVAELRGLAGAMPPPDKKNQIYYIIS